MKTQLSILFVLLLSSFSFLWSQNPLKYYVCDFENDAENSQWELSTRKKNKNATYYNQWYIGQATSNGGKNSLYISDSNGVSASYKGTLSVALAWRDIQLEEGDYDFVFDWKCVGDSPKISLRVAWIEDLESYDSLMFENPVASNLGEWYKNSTHFYTVDTTLLFLNSSVWQGVQNVLYSDGKKHRLVFIFTCDGNAKSMPPGPCVDNIEIRPRRCGKPTNIAVNTVGETATLTWSSPATSFDIKLQNVLTGEVNYAKNRTDTFYRTTLKHGVYVPYIKCICNGDSSVWYAFPPVIVFDDPCINYLNLTNENCSSAERTVGTGETGKFRDGDQYLQPGVVDYGYASVKSRHTIHYQPDEIDARTVGSFSEETGDPVPPLKVIPDGELAVVRLGAWNQARISRVNYDFTVDDEDASTLLIKYAIVLQNSQHFGDQERPRLTIDIVDPQTDEILDACTSIDLDALTSSTNKEGWYTRPASGKMDGTRNATDVNWRDWTTLGVNLEKYKGRTIRVKLTTYGCTYSAHYGYAYVIVKCISSMIEGIQCGDIPTNSFIAPDGFNYEWYKLYDNRDSILGRERIYEVDYKDTTTYGVRVINKAKTNCYFELTASAMPRYPIPDFSYQIIQRDCKNLIQFTNNSHIRKKNLNNDSIFDTDIKPDFIEWDFNNFEPQVDEQGNIPWNPLIELPSQEGEYTFSLTAHVGLCDSTYTIKVRVPEIGPDTVHEIIQICKGSYATHNGKSFTKDTTFIDNFKNRVGCDSVHYTHYKFVETIRDTLRYEIGEGDSVEFNGNYYKHSIFVSDTCSKCGGTCDSIAYLDLTVNEHLLMEISMDEMPCADENNFEIKIVNLAGIPNGYKLIFDSIALQQGFRNDSNTLNMASPGDTFLLPISIPNNAQPGWYSYTLSFTSLKNGSYSDSYQFELRYPQDIIAQRWNDILGILNEDYNGGYQFDEFQWYKNNQPIPGATKNYLYEEGGLDQNASYAVSLKRPNEQLSVMTCNFYPKPFTTPQNSEEEDNTPPFNQIKKIIMNNHLYILVRGKLYNDQGQRIE